MHQVQSGCPNIPNRFAPRFLARVTQLSRMGKIPAASSTGRLGFYDARPKLMADETIKSRGRLVNPGTSKIEAPDTTIDNSQPPGSGNLLAPSAKNVIPNRYSRVCAGRIIYLAKYCSYDAPSEVTTSQRQQPEIVHAPKTPALRNPHKFTQ